jgi:DNA-binding CsgD family transcriptional regulator
MIGGSKNTEGAVLSLAGMAYDAALDKHKWPLFLEEFANAVGGSSAMLRSVDLQTRKAGFVASAGYDSAWKSAYCNHFVKLDYMTPALNHFKLGEVKLGEHTISQSEQRKTEFYNDYCIPQDKVHNMSALLHKDGDRTLLFAAQRGKHGGTFGKEQVQLMNILAPHVTRAAHLHHRFSSITVEKEWALGALDQLRVGVILTNCSGKPLFVNRAAELIMAQCKGISVCHDRLVLNNPAETALLHRLIADAAQSFNGAAIGGDMRIALPNKVEFLHCLVSPVSPKLSARLDISHGSDCVAIFLSKPGGLQLPPKRLTVLYGLSPAESRLAAKLAAFNSLEQAAKELGVAMGTARTQLAAVFAKTGAKGQAELLLMLATGTLAHCRDG